MPHNCARVPHPLVGVQVREYARLAQERLRQPLLFVFHCRESDSLPRDRPPCEGQELALRGAGASSELRRQCRPAANVDAPEECEQTVDAVARLEVLREQVGGIVLAADLHELNGPIANPLLYPQALRVDMSQFAETLSTANAHRRCAVGPDTHGQSGSR